MNRLYIAIVPLFFALVFCAPVQAQTVVRGPYLQLQTEEGVTVHWRTDSSTDSVVRFGTSAGNLSNTVTVSGSTTEHSVQLTGLAPAQKYFYSVGDSIGALAGDATYHFHTAPVRGIAADTRIWVIGDSGTANSNARAVRDAFKSWSASDPADFWLMLGDNAYNDGTDSEYQAAVFDTYPELLRQLPLWATLGNHDGHSADSASQSGPYYDIFNLPANAEAGGLESYTEAYYSFDYANIHFVCLDSYDSSSAVNGSMMQWLQSDLALNTQPWVIAFWHHPPYTKGSHNSDTEGLLIDMRQNALPILEAWGVDLVMTGHSHTYERSYLIDGHYGSSGTLDPVDNVLDPGDGKEGSDGPYEKPGIVAAENAGAVYAVAGSSGKVSTGYPLNHPAMFVSLESLGSMVLDVSGNRLDAVFLDQTGAVRDEFTLLKTPDIDPPLISNVVAEDANHVRIDFNEPLNSTEALDANNYSIPGLNISQVELLTGDRSVRLTTTNMVSGNFYSLFVSNLRDLAGNTIPPNTSVNFEFRMVVTEAFQQGVLPSPSYGGARDAYIREASPTTAHGSETSLQVDGDEPSGTGTDMNILLAWDLSSIPDSATVEAAHFELTVTNVSGGVYNCNSLERSWDELQVTWNQAASGSSWGAPGAEAGSDRGSDVLCTVNASSAGLLSVNFTAAGLVKVQEWVTSPASNHGLIINHPSTSDGADFHARESGTVSARPKMIVTYSLPDIGGNEDPVAGFNFACTYLDCDFTDTSIDTDGSIVSWNWDFGDGNTSAAQNPSHSYAAAGGYTVSLTVTDNLEATDSMATLVTVTAPPVNIAPDSSFNHSCTDLDCSFTDTSSDSDGTVVSWSWNFGDGNSSTVQNPSHSYASAGDYTVSLNVTDNDGAGDQASALVSANEPPAFVDHFAEADLPAAGSVSGSYIKTHDDDGDAQEINETESGGKKSNRYSYLEHVWRFSVTPGASVTLFANVWSSGSSDGDEFVFAWSTNNATYTDLFTVSDTNTGNLESAEIPVSGVVYIRVRDTDRGQGNRNRDSIFVDQLMIRTGAATPVDPPAAPSGLSVLGVTAQSISLNWQHPSMDETGIELERSPTGTGSWSQEASLAAGSESYTDNGLASGTTYYYRVRAVNPGGESAWSNTASGTTDAAPPISLAATGKVRRGRHEVTLTWSGASGGSVDIVRDGSVVTVTSNDGTHIDETGNKGGRTYVYAVCEAGSTTCSNDVTVVF